MTNYLLPSWTIYMYVYGNDGKFQFTPVSLSISNNVIIDTFIHVPILGLGTKVFLL